MPPTNPQDAQQYFENQGSSALSGLMGTQSGFSGINNAGDVKSRYGIQDANSVYAPLFKTLAANRSRRMQGAGFRAGRSASPEMTFSNIEQGAEESQNQLLGNQAQSNIGIQQFIANLLQGAQHGQDSFALGKAGTAGGLASGLFGNRLNWQKFNREGEGPKFGDILGTLFGAAAPVVGAAVGAPGAGAGAAKYLSGLTGGGSKGAQPDFTNQATDIMSGKRNLFGG